MRREGRSRSAREDELLAAARRLLPAGVRTTTGDPDDALVIAAAHGAWLRDASGREYVDYLLGSGPMLLGHAHPAVVAAVARQLARGGTYLLVSEPAIALAEEIVRAVPCAEQVAFHGSGSESTLYALRLARAFRKRDVVLKFEGGFHGMSDYALMSTQWTAHPAPYPEAVPNSAGIPRAIAGTVLVAPFNDAETACALIDRHHDALAAVIVEPLQRTIPPAPGFLQALRDTTARRGIPLVFDEVVTGFRLAWGGAQEYYGVVPDLCALGKSISGGHPLSVLCGRAEIMGLVDPARARTGEHVMQTGTYSGNPVSCAAALAVLEELRRPGTYERLFATGRRLMEGLREALAAAGVAAQVTGEPPCFEVWMTERPVTDFRATLAADRARHARFTRDLLAHGVVKAHEKFFVSLAHGEAEVALTLEAFRAAAAALAGESPAEGRHAGESPTEGRHAGESPAEGRHVGGAPTAEVAAHRERAHGVPAAEIAPANERSAAALAGETAAKGGRARGAEAAEGGPAGSQAAAEDGPAAGQAAAESTRGNGRANGMSAAPAAARTRRRGNGTAAGPPEGER